MTDTSDERYWQPLGIGTIISETFSILAGNIPAVLILGSLPALVSLLVPWLLFGPAFLTGEPTPDQAVAISQNVSFLNFFQVSAISMTSYGAAIVLLAQMTYDVKLGRSVHFGRYFQRTLVSVVHIFVLSVVLYIIMLFAFFLFIIPALWAYAVFCVTLPALIIDRAGFGALGRSMFLSKGYRWPIVGLTIIMWVIGIAIFMVGSFLTGFIPGGIAMDLIFQVLLYGISFGVAGVSVALIYARLKEIKEGASVGDLVSVFE